MKAPKENTVVLPYAKERAEFTLMSDTFMSTYFRNIACAQVLLNDILDRDDLRVTYAETQEVFPNLNGKKAQLDILALDDNDTIYNIEIQCKAKGASPLRARYYSSIIDTNFLKSGMQHEQLPKTVVIFITEADTIGYGLPIYHIERIIKEKSISFGDKAEIIYVDAKNRSDTRLGRLMHDMHCKNAYEMKNPILAQNMRYWKETEEGQQKMCEIMEELVKKENAKAMYNHTLELAKKLLRRGRYSYAEIAEDTGLPIETVLELAKQQSA